MGMYLSIHVCPFIKVTCDKVESSIKEYKCINCKNIYNGTIKFCKEDGGQIISEDKKISKYPSEWGILNDNFEEDLFHAIPSEFVPCIKDGEVYILENSRRPKNAPKMEDVDENGDVIIHDNLKIESELNWFKDFYKKEIELLKSKYNNVEVGYGTFIYNS